MSVCVMCRDGQAAYTVCQKCLALRAPESELGPTLPSVTLEMVEAAAREAHAIASGAPWEGLSQGVRDTYYREAERVVRAALRVGAARVSSPAPAPTEPPRFDLDAARGIADYGWHYDGRTTFSVNCVDVASAQRLQALFRALEGHPPEPMNDDVEKLRADLNDQCRISGVALHALERIAAYESSVDSHDAFYRVREMARAALGEPRPAPTDALRDRDELWCRALTILDPRDIQRVTETFLKLRYEAKGD